MRNSKIFLMLAVLLSVVRMYAQPSFTLASSLCSGASTTVSANTGTMTAMAYNWAALPSGPVFSSPSSATTAISFPFAGTFTVGLGIVTGSGFSYTTEVITILATPGLTVTPPQPSVCAGFTETLTAFGASTFTWTGTNITTPVTSNTLPVGLGSYTLVGANGICTSSTTVSVGLNPPLSINVTQSSATTCIVSNGPKYSKPVHLTASGAATYVWFPYNSALMTSSIGPTSDVRPAASTCYTVIGSTAVCSGSATVCVTVIPQFSVFVNPPSAGICKGEAYNLTVTNAGTPAVGPSSAFTYSWTEALNAPPISISSYFGQTVSVFPQNTTTYTVEVMDAAQCLSYPSQVLLIVDGCVGLDKRMAKEFGFSVYPNPVKDKLSIRASTEGYASIQVMDAIGKIVVQENRIFTTDALTQTIPVNTLPAGVYFISIKTESEGIQVIRMIRQ